MVALNGVSAELHARVRAAMPEFGEHKLNQKKWRMGVAGFLVAITVVMLVLMRKDLGIGLLIMLVTVPIAGLRMFARLRSMERQDEAFERARVERYRLLMDALSGAKEKVVWLYRDPSKNESVACMADGNVFPLRDEDADGLLAAMVAELPHAVVGYTKAREVLFKKRPRLFMARRADHTSYRDSARLQPPDVDQRAEAAYHKVRIMKSIVLTIVSLNVLLVGQSFAEAVARAQRIEHARGMLGATIRELDKVARKNALDLSVPEQSFEACTYPKSAFVAVEQLRHRDYVSWVDTPSWAYTGKSSALSQFADEPLSIFGRSKGRARLDDLVNTLAQPPHLFLLRKAAASPTPRAARPGFTLMVNVIDVNSGRVSCAAKGRIEGSDSEYGAPMSTIRYNLETGRPQWWKLN